MKPSPPDAAPLIPAHILAWVSLTIFIHLFAVAIAISSYGSPSGLQSRLQTTLSPYTNSLNFDLYHAYRSTPRYYLTHDNSTDVQEGFESDVDYTLEIGANLDDPASPSVVVPAPGVWPGERRNRYQSLVDAIGALASNDSDLESNLIKPIAAYALDELKIKKAQVRCRARQLPTMSAVDGSPTGSPTATYRSDYRGEIFSSKGIVDLIKTAEAGENAPVRKGKKP